MFTVYPHANPVDGTTTNIQSKLAADIQKTFKTQRYNETHCQTNQNMFGLYIIKIKNKYLEAVFKKIILLKTTFYLFMHLNCQLPLT